MNSTGFALSRNFSSYGETDSESYTVGSQVASRWQANSRSSTGRILTKTETVGGTAAEYVYSYDDMGRLLTVTKDGTPVEEYHYDNAGTRNYEMNTLRGITGKTFTYNDDDRLLTAGTTAYQHDADGFLTLKTAGSDVTAYNYSSRGELLKVTQHQGTQQQNIIEYVHDPLGRRIAKKINGVIAEKYLWQGMTRLLAVYDGNNALLMRFEYADARMPFAMTMGSTTYFLTYDQVGSLRTVVNGSGNVVKQIEYDSFGNILNDTDPSLKIPFGFAGGLYDRDTGLVRFGYRDYDPDTGRWTAKDPIGFGGGDTDLYGYCVGDPINGIDPLGLKDACGKKDFLVDDPVSKFEKTIIWWFVYPYIWAVNKITGNEPPPLYPPFQPPPERKDAPEKPKSEEESKPARPPARNPRFPLFH